jgi:hypothetical protein
MSVPTDRDYWNHNTAYHPWLLDIATQRGGDVLDVGCGEVSSPSGSPRCHGR